jgi:hypothetical protein
MYLIVVLKTEVPIPSDRNPAFPDLTIVADLRDEVTLTAGHPDRLADWDLVPLGLPQHPAPNGQVDHLGRLRRLGVGHLVEQVLAEPLRVRRFQAAQHPIPWHAVQEDVEGQNLLAGSLVPITTQSSSLSEAIRSYIRLYSGASLWKKTTQGFTSVASLAESQVGHGLTAVHLM